MKITHAEAIILEQIRKLTKRDLCMVFSPEITCNILIYMVIYLILTT